MATAPASAAPAYLSMTSAIRMTPADSSRTDGGYFNEQVIYIAGVVSMSKAAAGHHQPQREHHRVQVMG
jgi:hypothetical protein